MRLSQSVLKMFIEYREGNFCGLKFKAFYIDKTHRTQSSEAQLAGQYFEYCATGQKNYYGEVPEPPKLKGGGMPMPFVRAEAQAIECKRHLFEMGFEIIGTGYKAEDLKARYKIRDGFDLTIDVLAKYVGEDFQFRDIDGNRKSFIKWLETRKPGNRELVIDLKYSGALDTSFGDYAWGHDPAGVRLTMKRKIKIQALHYYWLLGIPFAWMVYSSKPDMEALFLMAGFDPEGIASYAEQAQEIRRKISHEIKINGFRAIPSLSGCRECVLRPNCKFAATSPIPEIVYVDAE
jgi:hypothetical protein